MDKDKSEDKAKAKPEKGMKYDAGKPDWSLMPFRALNEVVDVLTFGAKKYAPDNWRHVDNPRRRYFSAVMRHMSAWVLGEKLDPETGKSHLAHAVCDIIFLFELEKDGKFDKSEVDYKTVNEMREAHGLDKIEIDEEV